MGEIKTRAYRWCMKKFSEELNELINTLPKDKYPAKEIAELLNSFQSSTTLPSYTGSAWDFSEIKKKTVLVNSERILIRPMTESDKDDYYHICSQYFSILKKNPGGEYEKIQIDMFAEDIRKDEGLFCMIEKMPERSAIGYIAIKDTRTEPWELAIELDRNYLYQGYGTESIRLFLILLAEITGRTEYKAVVEPDNIPCRRCMEKIGAVYSRLCYSSILKTDEERVDFAMENTDLINDELRKTAKELQTTPEILLTHWIEYSIRTDIIQQYRTI